MGAESKSFPQVVPPPCTPLSASADTRSWALWLQISLVYSLILMASWTPEGPWKSAWMVLAACAVASFALCSRYTVKQMGLGLPAARGVFLIIGLGIALASTLPVVATWSGLRFPPVRVVPWRAAWQYGIWALMQQFTLQSFFFLRMESLLGGRRAVAAAALLFASVHLPSPILTIATLIGGFFFCEMFRRYRSILPLGVVHALLGLTIAASFSDHLLHHMRVGIGYLAFHA